MCLVRVIVGDSGLCFCVLWFCRSALGLRLLRIPIIHSEAKHVHVCMVFLLVWTSFIIKELDRLCPTLIKYWFCCTPHTCVATCDWQCWALVYMPVRSILFWGCALNGLFVEWSLGEFYLPCFPSCQVKSYRTRTIQVFVAYVPCRACCVRRVGLLLIIPFVCCVRRNHNAFPNP